MNELERIEQAAAFLRTRLADIPRQAVILGSGLGDFARRLDLSVTVPYGDIPGFPKPTVAGHAGELIAGRSGEVPVLLLAGRFHFYEGHDLATVVRPVRVLKSLGVERLVVTNAAGGVNAAFKPGDLMLIRDHINMAGHNPLIGENLEAFGPRFPDMSDAYAPALIGLARDAAARLNLDLKEGVYAWMSGPSYETPAEIRMLRTLGADAVGMSTAPEVIAAAHAGMAVLGISLITNMAAGVLATPLRHADVLETAARAARRFETLIEAVLKGM